MSESEYMKTHNIAKATIHELSENERESIFAAIAKEDDSEFDPRKDLIKMVSVLVSTGKNRNDDVFLTSELAKVRYSGTDKPLNIEHNPDAIVGHMTKSYLTRKDGTEISDKDVEKSKLPEDFDITNEAVIYGYAKPQVAKAIRKLAAAGQLYVSVEMWFTDYDYLVGSKVIKRCEATQHLDECLRINGGDGVYKGSEVGRVLRNSLIGGVGIVEKPANPESVIKSISSLGSESTEDVEMYDELYIADNVIEDLSSKSRNDQKLREEDMSNIFEELKETVKASTEVAVKEALKNQASEEETSTNEEVETEKVVEKTTETATEEKSVSNEEIELLRASIKEVKDENKALAGQISELKDAEDERVLENRREALRELKLSDEDVQKRMVKCASMTHEEFVAYRDDLLDLFNRYLRGEASEKESADEGGDEDLAVTADASEKDAEDSDSVDASDSEEGNAEDTEDEKIDASEDTSEDDEEDTVIDMTKIENEDVDLGSTETAPNKSNLETLTDKFESALTRQLASRNKYWRKMTAKKQEQEDEDGE
jgi:hypothetical protein